uniref:Uncharacterized protein n=1 Tax=Podarcis muralis TaxID=64176 RepID=A0A670JVV2_PODMU
MNSYTYTPPLSRHKSRTPISPCPFKYNSLYNFMIRMSIQLKICPNRSPSSYRTNNFLRSYSRHYLTLYYYINRRLYNTYPYYYTRTYMIIFTHMTLSHNMICFNPSRNKPSTIRLDRRRIRTCFRVQCRICSRPLRTFFSG